MQQLTQQVLADLWRDAKSHRQPEDENLAAFQKFMILHEDMYEHWERLELDPTISLEIGGENLLLHIAVDAATEQSLQADRPAGIRGAFLEIVQAGLDEGLAFHVLAQALQHEFMIGAEQGRGLDERAYLDRARRYGAQAIEQSRQEAGEEKPQEDGASTG